MTDQQFKVPVPRKRSAFNPVRPDLNKEHQSLNLLRKTNQKQSQKLRLLKLLIKLCQSPGSLTNGERITLMSHPIIKNLINYSKDHNWGPGNFYIPVDSLLNSIFEDLEEGDIQDKDCVEVIFEKATADKRVNQASPDIKYQNSRLVTQNRPTNSNHSFSADLKEHRIGFYTKTERQVKIRKYRQKIANWLNRKKSDKSKSLKKPQIPSSSEQKMYYPLNDFDMAGGVYNMSSCNSNSEQENSSCFRQFLSNFEYLPRDQNLNEIVAQISGIN